MERRNATAAVIDVCVFNVGDEIYFGKDRLRDVEERILELR